MYSFFRHACEQALRIPPEPEAPPGDEESTQVFRAAPNYYRYLLVLWGLRTLALFVVLVVFLIGPIAAAGGAFRSNDHSLFFSMSALGATSVAAFILFSLGYLALVKLDFEKRWYVVTDRSLRIREGVISVKELTVTFVNIQNISISQGPIQRLLGIADLRVDTAGGGGSPAPHGQSNQHVAWFRGISTANAVRSLIQDRLKTARDSGLGDETVERGLMPGRVSVGMIESLRAVQAESRGLHRAALALKGVVGRVP